MSTQFQVIVTRPSPYGEQLCDTLERENFFSLHRPLIRFEHDNSVDNHQRLGMLDNAGTWIFISRQAVNFCFNSFDQQQLNQVRELSQHKILIAVGSATADSLQQLGFDALIPPTSNSEGMIALLKKHQLQDSPALLVRGNKGRKLLEQFYHQQQLQFLPVYNRVKTEHSIPALTNDQVVSAIIASSGQLLELIAQQVDSKEQVTIIAGSERINKIAQHIGFTNCYTAKNASNLELVKTCILWRNNVS